jgi:hypothetical protein
MGKQEADLKDLGRQTEIQLLIKIIVQRCEG